MADHIEITDLPFEVQKGILDRLDEKDLISMHRVSKSWQSMIVRYMDDTSSIKATDWRWFCRHSPRIERCSECLKKIRNKNDIKDLADDWNWWVQNTGSI